jgi:hypothetical protein
MTQIGFVPLDKLKLYLGLETATLTDADNDRLKTALLSATTQIEALTGRWLTPRRAIVDVDFQQGTELYLDHDLMEIISITNGDGQAIASGDIDLVSGSVLRLINGSRWVRGKEGRALPIEIVGTWGWHNNWNEAWRVSGDEINGILDPFGTSIIPVQDSDGSDPFGDSPRFRIGQLLRVNTEIMSLIGIDAVNNTLTVLRGQMGTGVGLHLVGASIDIYTPPPYIEMLIVRWAAWLYKSPERGGTYSSIPDDLMDEARIIRRVTVR